MAMTLLEAIDKRCTRYNYINQPIDCIGEVKKLLFKANTVQGIHLEHFEDSKKMFSQMNILYGSFRNVKNVVLLRADRNDENAKEKIGYYGEEFMLGLTALGLGASWVALNFDKSRAQYDTDTHELIAVIVFGHVEEEKTDVEISMYNLLHKKPHELTDVFVIDVQPQPWLLGGMAAVLKAPTAINKMKPRFRVLAGIVEVRIDDDFYLDRVDLGIVKFHFEIGSGNAVKFPLGNNVQINH